MDSISGTSRASLTILTEYFYPENASTAQLLTELATELSDTFNISVLTARPNYHGQDRQDSVERTEQYEGVQIRRLMSTRFDKDVLPLRVVNWLSFTLLATLALLWSHRDSDANLVVSNPPTLPFAAWTASRINKSPYVFVVHDLYPELPMALGYLDEDGLLGRAWRRWMRMVYRDADRIVVLGEAMREKILDVMSGDPEFDSSSVIVIHNWEDPDFIKPIPKTDNQFAAEHSTRDRFTMTYSGNIGRFHDLETAISAIDVLESRGRDDVQLLVIGEGAKKERLQNLVENRNIENVKFLPFQPHERLPETLTSGDAALVGVEREVSGLCVSSKLYSSLAAGVPILAVTGPDDDVARVVRENECGIHVEPSDIEKAAEVLASWADNPERVDRLGRNARRLLVRDYSRNRAISRYEAAIDEVLSG